MKSADTRGLTWARQQQLLQAQHGSLRHQGDDQANDASNEQYPAAQDYLPVIIINWCMLLLLCQT